MTTTLADYEVERRAFDALLTETCSERILLYKGTSGSGKSTLLTHCLARVPTDTLHVRFDFKGQIPLPEVFHLTGQRLGWQRLPCLSNQIDQMQGPPTVNIEGNRQKGFGNRITVVLHAENPVDREHRSVLLTDALFEDLQDLGQPILIAFDTFEKASTDMKGWITGPLLARSEQVNTVRIVIAGQEVPDKNSIVWGHCCQEYVLRGVREAHHWLPVIVAKGRYVPVPDQISGIATICELLRGKPDQINAWIETLPLVKDLS